MKQLRFWMLIVTYTVLMLADGALTYFNTPDLSMEGNPLVANFGLGWGALAIANAVVFALLFCAAYYGFFRYQPRFNEETIFTCYVSQLLFDRPDRFWTGLIPKHFAPVAAMFGVAMLYAGIVARVVVVAEWLTISFGWNWTLWWKIRANFIDRVDLVLALVTWVIAAIGWFYKQYRFNQKQQTGTA